jgi:hypothetical protein
MMLKRNPLIVFKEEFDGTGVLFDPEKGSVLGLNTTGCFLWKNVEEASDMADLVGRLCDACTGVPEDRVASDVEIFIRKLQDNGFVSEE